MEKKVKLKVVNGPVMGSYGLALTDAIIDVTEEEAKSLEKDKLGEIVEEEEEGEKEDKRGRETKEEKSAKKSK